MKLTIGITEGLKACGCRFEDLSKEEAIAKTTEMLAEDAVKVIVQIEEPVRYERSDTQG